MKKYFDYCLPIMISTLFGFVVGYGIQIKKIKNLKLENLNLIKQISLINNNNCNNSEYSDNSEYDFNIEYI